jgi:hypothetical protein
MQGPNVLYQGSPFIRKDYFNRFFCSVCTNRSFTSSLEGQCIDADYNWQRTYDNTSQSYQTFFFVKWTFFLFLYY